MIDTSTLIDTPDYVAIRDAFLRELTLSAQGQKTSIPFIKNPLPQASLVAPHQRFQVFVIGGTHGECALVEMEEDKKFRVIEERLFTPLPKFTTKDDFLTFIQSNLYEDVHAIGINFSYNLTPIAGEEGELDGILNQAGTKGNAFEGLEQEQVGKTIREYLKAKKGLDVVITVANDTICLITAGLEEGIDRSDLVAAIAGTGYNLAIFLDNVTIVNLQASDFTGFSQTTTGKVVDQQSGNAGEQLYNKEVAAGELYKHFNILIQTMQLSHAPLESGEELSAVAMVNEDQEGEIARALLERSASFVAAQLAAIYLFKGKKEKLICIAQGSLFWKEEKYIGYLLQRLETLGVPRHGIELRELEKADLIGAIKLVIV